MPFSEFRSPLPSAELMAARGINITTHSFAWDLTSRLARPLIRTMQYDPSHHAIQVTSQSQAAIDVKIAQGPSIMIATDDKQIGIHRQANGQQLGGAVILSPQIHIGSFDMYRAFRAYTGYQLQPGEILVLYRNGRTNSDRGDQILRVDTRHGSLAGAIADVFATTGIFTYDGNEKQEFALISTK